MIDSELLKILCCPETHQAVALVDEKLLGELNHGIVSGKVRNRAGRIVKETLIEALVRIDGKMIYPVRNGIPVLLMDEGICPPPGPS